jgi:putative Holliday junction resolvase
LDVSKKRIGIAICDTEIGAVHPIATATRHSIRQDLDVLRRELESRSVEKIVVGLPLNMDGTEGPAARRMRTFASEAESALGIPVEFCDERLTSFEARERIRGLPVARSQRRPTVDALAAMLILENWLEKNRPLRR